MLNKIKRWFVRTFGPINQIDGYILNNWKTPTTFTKSKKLEIRRWVIKSIYGDIEIAHKRQTQGDIIELFINHKQLITYMKLNNIVIAHSIEMRATKDELENIYENICNCFKK